MQALQAVPWRRPSRAQQVVTLTCEYFGLDQQVLRAHTRTCRHCLTRNGCVCGCSPRGAAYTEARMLACYLLSEDLAVACTRIGLLLHRDHSTVAYYVAKAHRLLPARSDLRWHLEQVRAILREKRVLW